MNCLSRLALSLTATALLCLASAATARADTVVFSNRTDFLAAATGLTTINFEGIAPTNSVANFSSPLTLQGVTFSGSPTGAVSVVDSGFFAPLFDYGSGAVLSGFAFVDVTLPPGITALGTDIMSTNPDGLSFQVVLATGESFVVGTPARPARGFFGVTSDVAISSIRFTTIPNAGGSSGIPLLDNFTFGQAQGPAPVPEPATMILLGTGLVGVVSAARKRRKATRAE